jgi:hypothetical protein
MRNEGMLWRIIDNRTDEVVDSIMTARGQTRQFIMGEYYDDPNYRLEGGPLPGAVDFH